MDLNLDDLVAAVRQLRTKVILCLNSVSVHYLKNLLFHSLRPAPPFLAPE